MNQAKTMIRGGRGGRTGIKRSTRHSGESSETQSRPQFPQFMAAHSPSIIEPFVQGERINVEEFMAIMIEKQRKIKEKFPKKVDEVL